MTFPCWDRDEWSTPCESNDDNWVNGYIKAALARQCPKQRAIWLIKRSLMCAGLNAQTLVQCRRLVNESAGLCISSTCFKYASAEAQTQTAGHFFMRHMGILKYSYCLLSFNNIYFFAIDRWFADFWSVMSKPTVNGKLSTLIAWCLINKLY